MLVQLSCVTQTCTTKLHPNVNWEDNRSSTLSCHREEHRAEIWYKPDQPNDDAKFVEIVDPSLVFPDKDNRRPYSMHKHQKDGQQSRKAMHIEHHPTCEFEHQPSSPGITNQP